MNECVYCVFLQRQMENMENEYHKLLHEQVQEKSKKVDAFLRQKYKSIEKIKKKKYASELQRQKFSQIIKDIMRSSNGLEKLKQMGIDLTDLEHTDPHELLATIANYTPVSSPTKSNKCNNLTPTSSVKYTKSISHFHHVSNHKIK